MHSQRLAVRLLFSPFLLPALTLIGCERPLFVLGTRHVTRCSVACSKSSRASVCISSIIDRALAWAMASHAQLLMCVHRTYCTRLIHRTQRAPGARPSACARSPSSPQRAVQRMLARPMCLRRRDNCGTPPRLPCHTQTGWAAGRTPPHARSRDSVRNVRHEQA